MKGFIGIQIPPELRREITSFCRARQYVSTEPHITVIDSRYIDNSATISHKLESFCLSQSDFKVVVAGPNTHGDLLYLTVLPGVISIVRDRLARHLHITSGRVYRPHITIMRQYAGRHLDLDRFLEEARQTFTKPFSFDVSELTFYSQKDENSPFKPISAVPFTGK